MTSHANKRLFLQLGVQFNVMYARGGALHGVCDVIVALAVVAAAAAVVDGHRCCARDRPKTVSRQETSEKTKSCLNGQKQKTVTAL